MIHIIYSSLNFTLSYANWDTSQGKRIRQEIRENLQRIYTNRYKFQQNWPSSQITLEEKIPHEIIIAFVIILLSMGTLWFLFQVFWPLRNGWAAFELNLARNQFGRNHMIVDQFGEKESIRRIKNYQNRFKYEVDQRMEKLKNDREKERARVQQEHQDEIKKQEQEKIEIQKKKILSKKRNARKKKKRLFLTPQRPDLTNISSVESSAGKSNLKVPKTILFKTQKSEPSSNSSTNRGNSLFNLGNRTWQNLKKAVSPRKVSNKSHGFSTSSAEIVNTVFNSPAYQNRDVYGNENQSYNQDKIKYVEKHQDGKNTNLNSNKNISPIAAAIKKRCSMNSNFSTGYNHNSDESIDISMLDLALGSNNSRKSSYNQSNSFGNYKDNKNSRSFSKMCGTSRVPFCPEKNGFGRP